MEEVMKLFNWLFFSGRPCSHYIPSRQKKHDFFKFLERMVS